MCLHVLGTAGSDFGFNAKYSGKEGVGFEVGVDKLVGQFVNLIDQKYLSTSDEYRPVEFSHKSQYFALDVISELGFGEAIGFLSNDKDMYKYVEMNDSFFPVLAVLLNMPWLSRLLQSWPLNKALPKEGDEYGFGGMMGCVSSPGPRSSTLQPLLLFY